MFFMLTITDLASKLFSKTILVFVHLASPILDLRVLALVPHRYAHRDSSPAANSASSCSYSPGWV